MQEYNDSESKSMTVLVVGNCAIVRNILLAMLDECGCDTIVEESGQKAVDFYQKVRDEINMILLDLDLSDSFGGTKILASLYRINPKVKVVVISGFFPDPAQMISTPGVTALLHKPFSYSEFNEIIQDTAMDLVTA